MKHLFVSAAFAMAFAVVVVGCAGDTSGPSEAGSVGVNLIVGNTDVTAVNFDVVCDSGTTLSGKFNVNDEQDPPVWAAIMDLPPGPCSIALTALDAQGAVLCTGSADFTVLVDQTVKVNVVLTCGEPGFDPLGNVDIDATFEIIQGNNCPRLHFLNAVPNNVPAEGSEVTVLVSDADGNALTTALTATGGSFADPAAQSTTYTCDGAAGGQTISVTVTDGDAACDKSKSFDVVCPGVDPCEGVECPDTGNECTVGICTNQSAPDCEETNVANGIACNAGGGGELTTNGGFETGDTSGWEFFPNDGTFAATSAQANGGTYSGNLIASVPAGGGPPSFPVIKQANIGIGTVQPNSSCDISFDLFGSVSGAGGVFFAEFFSELSGGGTSSSVILGGGPLFPNGTWTTYAYTTPTGNDVSGGVTLQLKTDCGANPGCTVDAFIDNVSVTCGSGGGGEAGTCQEGVCVPSAECVVAADCPDTGNECIDAVCDAGTCGTSNNTNACDGGNGTCNAGVCEPNAECVVAGDCPDDGNECTDPVCNAGTCETSNNTSACDGGAGTCNAGTCEPNAEVVYEQDFNQLDINAADALTLDGWLVFGNVFNSGGVFLFGFGPFGAPNGGQGFSAIVNDQGGPGQEPQQLSVYSDYGCCQPSNGHFNGTDLVEALVFQEPRSAGSPITAADIGKTFTFSFDAKNGDIQPPTTARAYIQTLNPNAGFSQTNFVPIDMTSIGTSWNSYEISLPLTDPALQGQILQFGFSSTTSNFAQSQNVYDNVLTTLE